LPVDHHLGDNTVASTATVTIALAVEETQALLQDVPGIYHTQINDVLLTAMAEALRKWTSATSLLVDLEGHGREEILDDIDLSRTVGWFTTITPVVLQVAPSFQPGTAMTSIKEQLRRIPNRGIGYGVLRYLGTDGPRTKLETAREPEISFNYLGQIDPVAPRFGFFGAANDFAGSLYSPRGNRCHLIDCIGNVVERQLRLSFTYSVNFHRAETIQRLADDYREALRAIIEHCQSAEAGGFSASDFLAARMSQDDFNNLLTKINKSVDSQN
jgi:non-ribosomal peptide synthase protein (TIGR01720 family)